MAIIVNLDVMLARNKMKSKELAQLVGITEQNLSLLKSGKVKGIRFSTLEAICTHLNCQPGDILAHTPEAMPVAKVAKKPTTLAIEDEPVMGFDEPLGQS